MIIHVLRDGTEVDDISGHVVRVDDAKELYELITSDTKSNKDNN